MIQNHRNSAFKNLNFNFLLSNYLHYDKIKNIISGEGQLEAVNQPQLSERLLITKLCTLYNSLYSSSEFFKVYYLTRLFFNLI